MLGRVKEDTMRAKETSKKRLYLKWPWNVLVYIVLVVVLHIFSIPVILLILGCESSVSIRFVVR